MTRLRRALLLIVVGLLGYGIAWAQPFVFRPALVPGQDAITDAASARARVSLDDVGGRVLSIRPETSDGDLLLVLYPGGLVRPQAYEWLGRALAEQGVQTVIPEFFADLAVTGKDRADALIAHYAAGRTVVIGGHSLGGAMAADYASRHADKLSGLILLAAYPAGGIDLTGTRFSSLSLMGENDQVADAAKVRGGMAQLSPSSRLEVVPGSVHAFFGRYGPQAGDGMPSVDRASAEQAIIERVVAYLGERR
ncbi:alpha/beta hydrolase [Micropruina glycogenica]|uniref:Carboxymethylenebutenolidase-like protein n=1 Tax=Micropruina glycogenica TaxID=75385 RepID=A0A2N9JER3_9ACTN|nr:alpha/beta hydrolase [Micropruina glycogenica]SPD86050.1 Carboxymethylenebutenolidase-like protein [Micropruina glycogenica]